MFLLPVYFYSLPKFNFCLMVCSGGEFRKFFCRPAAPHPADICKKYGKILISIEKQLIIIYQGNLFM